jgi:hypothetical protein
MVLVNPMIVKVLEGEIHQHGYEQARRELKDLLVKTRHLTPLARLVVAVTWAGGSMQDISDMTGTSGRTACCAPYAGAGSCVCLHDCGATACKWIPF